MVHQNRLELFRNHFRGVEVCAYEEDFGPFECWASMLSLVHIFGIRTPADLPSKPYLRATSAFRPLLGSFKVGIVWETMDPMGATQLADWAPVLDLAGVTFYSFQVFDLRGDPRTFGDPTELGCVAPRVRDLAPELATWSHTTAALAQMDLVIAIDCSVANLAGAMGLPVWICLRAAGEWRWLLDRRDSPWYPTARLYRQRKLGDWPGVFAEVARDLGAQVEQGRVSIASHVA